MNLNLMHERYSVCMLDPAGPIPDWLHGPGILSSTYSESELSIVCPQQLIPEGVQQEADWCALQIEGPLAFDQVGILYALLGPLAKAQIPVFVLSTYLTDTLFVRANRFLEASHALEEAGHNIQVEK